MLAQADAAYGLAYSHADRAADDTPPACEYRIGELAREARITVRTLRYY
jgi:MerR HTH family regulatory protein